MLGSRAALQLASVHLERQLDLLRRWRVVLQHDLPGRIGAGHRGLPVLGAHLGDGDVLRLVDAHVEDGDRDAAVVGEAEVEILVEPERFAVEGVMQHAFRADCDRSEPLCS